jgi:hypothetical protein
MTVWFFALVHETMLMSTHMLLTICRHMQQPRLRPPRAEAIGATCSVALLLCSSACARATSSVWMVTFALHEVGTVPALLQQEVVAQLHVQLGTVCPGGRRWLRRPPTTAHCSSNGPPLTVMTGSLPSAGQPQTVPGKCP